MSYTADEIWNALRDVGCVTGRKAHRIVMVHKSDVEKAVALLEKTRAITVSPQLTGESWGQVSGARMAWDEMIREEQSNPSTR